MENKQHRLVGAPRFELGTACAQGRRITLNNTLLFSVTAETKQLIRDRSMWLAVPTCGHQSVRWAQRLAHPRWCPGVLRLLPYCFFDARVGKQPHDGDHNVTGEGDPRLHERQGTCCKEDK